jgi:hypothetical protein
LEREDRAPLLSGTRMGEECSLSWQRACGAGRERVRGASALDIKASRRKRLSATGLLPAAPHVGIERVPLSRGFLVSSKTLGSIFITFPQPSPAVVLLGSTEACHSNSSGGLAQRP